MSLSETIKAKSDQLNADDIIGNPITIKITDVNIVKSDQPVVINYEGDNGKPYKPSKGMRRAIICAWGDDEKQFSGRLMTLYYKSDVTYAGKEVGGIRISHMSHINNKVTFALTVSRGKKVPYSIFPIEKDDKNDLNDEDKNYYIKKMAECETIPELKDIADDIKSKNYKKDQLNILLETHKENTKRIRRKEQENV